MNLPAIMDMVPGLSADEALDYAPSTGNARLRRRWLDDMFAKNPSLAGKEVSLPVVTSGVTHGLTVAGETVRRPGRRRPRDRNKFWGKPYNMVFGVRRGADVRRFPLFVDGERASTSVAWRLRLARLSPKRARRSSCSTSRTTLRVLDPTLRGRRGGRRDMLCRRARTRGCRRPRRPLTSVCTTTMSAWPSRCSALLAGRSEHVFPVKLDGVTKEEYAWGLRVGFITFSAVAGGKEKDLYAALEKKAGGTIRGNISNCSQLSQSSCSPRWTPPGSRNRKETSSS